MDPDDFRQKFPGQIHMHSVWFCSCYYSIYITHTTILTRILTRTRIGNNTIIKVGERSTTIKLELCVSPESELFYALEYPSTWTHWRKVSSNTVGMKQSPRFVIRVRMQIVWT
jgi:hypothetical protein